MLVPPRPIGLLILAFELGERSVFAVVLFHPHAIRTIFMIAPMMIVVVLRVMVDAIFGSKLHWSPS